MNQKRTDFGITYDTVRKEVYVIGGRYGQYDIFEQCEKFSIQTGEWTIIAPMSKMKMNASACMINNQFIFAIGGNNRRKSSNDIEKYSIVKNSWQTIEIVGEVQMSPR